MSDESEKLKAVGDFISALTPRSLLLGSVAGIVGIGLYQLFDARAVAFAYILNSPSMLWTLGAGTLLLAVGYLVAYLLNKSEKFLLLKIEDQDKEIDKLRAELEDCKTECKAGVAAMLTSIKEKVDAIASK